MRTSTFAIIPLAAILLAGCSQSTLQPTPTSAAAPASVCALSNTKGDTCFVKGNGKRICHAFVGLLPDGRPYVFPQVMVVPRGSAGNRDARIVWHLADPRFEFTRADGPLELKTDADFEESGPTDDGEGDHQDKPSARKYRINFKNMQGVPHDYRIAFRQGSTVHTCDPRITNDSN